VVIVEEGVVRASGRWHLPWSGQDMFGASQFALVRSSIKNLNSSKLAKGQAKMIACISWLFREQPCDHLVRLTGFCLCFCFVLQNRDRLCTVW
jgi:hypothetical protein